MPYIDEDVASVKKLSYNQVDFSGGMNLFSDDTNIGETEYREAFNVRNRTKTLKPVTQIIELTTAPVGLKQGIYGFDSFYVLFIAGKAYFQIIGTTTWINIVGFQMSATANVIYAEAVPASTFNLHRSLQVAGNSQGTALNTGITINPTITATLLPAGLVCQDGINQPWLILPDKSSRVLQTYSQWTLDNREYVPIGTQMRFVGGILFISSPDGTQLFRSVEGRPIDFGVNIDINGLISGDASTVSYAVNYNPMTCLAAMNSGQLFVGTTLGCFPVTIDYTSLIFGEPTFDNNQGIYSGVVNQFSFQEILGDYAFVDYTGMRSFNAVQSENNEGRNDIFSVKISNMLARIVQSSIQSCSTVFDNYALFSVNTIYGYGILVYDTLNKVWASFDPTPEPIIGLATTSVNTSPRVFGISATKVYELYSTTSPVCIPFVRLKSITTGDLTQELKTKDFRAVFFRSNGIANANVTEYMDEQRGDTITQPLTDSTGGVRYSANYPVYFDSAKAINNLVFDFSANCNLGFKLGALVSWENSAELVQFQIDAEVERKQASTQQQESSYASGN